MTHTNMVFLAITPSGLADALRTAGPDDAVWCGSDAISQEEYELLAVHNLSRFGHELGDQALIDDAMDTVKDHHPGQTIWIEAKASK